MANTPRKIRPMGDYEKPLFFAMTPEEDLKLGCIGHVRIDFRRTGREFWHTWWPRAWESLNDAAFKEELSAVVDELKKDVLSGLSGMRRFCADHGGYMEGGWAPNYGYVIETENRRYFLRCNPMPGDYNAYLNCFDRHTLEMNQDKVLCSGVLQNTDPEQGNGDLTMGGLT